jgi:hypothetical protein
VAPAITAPDGSVTRPEKDAVAFTCAVSRGKERTEARRTTAAHKAVREILIIWLL